MQSLTRPEEWPQLIWGIATVAILLGVGITPWLRFL